MFATPPVSFYFQLYFGGSSSASGTDAAFQEVSGLTMHLETEEVIEGGENRFKHQLPTRVQYDDLVLKRGYIAFGSLLRVWIEKTLNGGLNTPIETQNITLQLMNNKGNPITTWAFENAYPVKWETTGMNAEKSELLIESITFKYNYFERL